MLNRKAHLLPISEQEVTWFRYTGDVNELEQFVNNTTRFKNERHEFYLATNNSKEVYWKEHGFIKDGDFVIANSPKYLQPKYDGFAIVCWKDFPRMTVEDIPLHTGPEYDKWLEEFDKEQYRKEYLEQYKQNIKMFNEATNNIDKNKYAQQCENIKDTWVNKFGFNITELYEIDVTHSTMD